MHLHEPGEDAEGRGERNDPPVPRSSVGVELWEIEMIPGAYQALRGGDERTRTADPLLAKYGRDSDVTRAFTVRAGHPSDSRLVQRLPDDL